MHLQMKLATEMLSEAALEQIFQSAVRILRQVPFRIQGTPELMDWLPEFNDFRIAGAWQESPSDIIDRARDKAREMVRAAKNQCPLSEDQRAEIQRLVDAANRDAAGSLTR